jgi:hypothetical protein
MITYLNLYVFRFYSQDIDLTLHSPYIVFDELTKMASRYQLGRDEDDGLTCRLCLQAFWMKEELKKHLTDVHSFTEKDQEEERRRNVQRIMEQRRRIALAQQQRMQSSMTASGRGGGIMRG